MKINEMAERAFRNALKRCKTMVEIDHGHTARGLFEEFYEFVEACEFKRSEHMSDVSEAVEELTDILIASMTELYRRDVDVERVVLAKIEFNEKRNENRN